MAKLKGELIYRGKFGVQLRHYHPRHGQFDTYRCWGGPWGGINGGEIIQVDHPRWRAAKAGIPRPRKRTQIASLQSAQLRGDKIDHEATRPIRGPGAGAKAAGTTGSSRGASTALAPQVMPANDPAFEAALAKLRTSTDPDLDAAIMMLAQPSIEYVIKRVISLDAADLLAKLRADPMALGKKIPRDLKEHVDELREEGCFTISRRRQGVKLKRARIIELAEQMDARIDSWAQQELMTKRPFERTSETR
jgi:hypothetical protein